MGTKQNDPPNEQPIIIELHILKPAYKKALLYASKKLRKFKSSGLVSKLEPLDLVHEAYEKTISGKRSWDSEKTPDLFVHFAGCINSILSNTYRSADFNVIDRNESTHDLLMHQTSACNIEDSLEFDSKVRFILDYLAATRKDIKAIAKLMLKEGVTKPQEIASILGISIKEVNTQKVALRRIMKKTSFRLRYISQNRPDLLEIARAVYIQKITDIRELSKILKISTDEVEQQLHDLECVMEDINRGVI